MEINRFIFDKASVLLSNPMYNQYKQLHVLLGLLRYIHVLQGH